MVDDKEDEINEIMEELENQENPDKWSEAHEKYDNGSEQMLENMVNGLTASHALKTMREYNGALSKKGQYLDYDEWHSLSASGAIVGLSYVWHPLALTLWAYLTKKIIDHSWSDCKGSDRKHFMETVHMFGLEIWYWVGGALGAAWFFEEFTSYGLNLGDAGTMAQIGLEVTRLFFGGA